MLIMTLNKVQNISYNISELIKHNLCSVIPVLVLQYYFSS
jgi:hypothetical protein